MKADRRAREELGWRRETSFSQNRRVGELGTAGGKSHRENLYVVQRSITGLFRKKKNCAYMDARPPDFEIGGEGKGAAPVA